MPTEMPETFVDANKNKEVEAALRQWLEDLQPKQHLLGNMPDDGSDYSSTPVLIKIGPVIHRISSVELKRGENNDGINLVLLELGNPVGLAVGEAIAWKIPANEIDLELPLPSPEDDEITQTELIV